MVFKISTREIIQQIYQFCNSFIACCVIVFWAIIYQLFVYATLKLYDDAQKDSLNTVRTYYEHALIYFELLNYNPKGAEIYKNTIKRHINLISNESFLNTDEVLGFYDTLNKCLDENNWLTVKSNLISINHIINHLDLEFMHSIFLRVYKSRIPKVGKEYMKEHNIEIK